jgi:hypothetical protein
MTVRGVFASHSSIVGDRQNTLSGRILKKGFGGTAPLLALSAGMKEEKVSDTNWSWIEDSHISGNTKSTAGVASTVTTVVPVDDANIWAKNSILLVEATGEYLLVISVDSNTQVTVRRGFAGTTAANIPANGTIQLIGTAFEEGGGRPDAVAQNGQSFLNFVQIFKNGWAITGTAKAVEYLTGPKLADNKEMALQYHAEDIERSFLWGKKAVTTLNGKELRLSNGIVAQIEQYGGLVTSANYGSVAGQMSLDGFQDFIYQLFLKTAKGLPNERIGFSGANVLNLMQKMARKDTRYDMTVEDTSYGFNVTVLNYLGNKLKLLSHPLMTENATWNKEVYVFHPGLVKKKVLRDTWTQEFYIKNNTNINGADADEGYIADELGFELKGAELCGIMRNVTTAVASA